MLETPAPHSVLHYVDDMGLDTTCSIDEFKCPITLEVRCTAAYTVLLCTL